ncbi:caspase family protein [Aequorivita sp. Q41]|uniref:caspase family protein n=1 Tax=Aequorivita sp. Q41 TaxID=3153300 RepID=UPI0032420DAE
MRKALVVGINNYPSAPLAGCINDASALGSTIEVNGDGSPNFDVRLITDIPTKAELKGKIKELFSGDAETVLFYFSGHGFFDELGGGFIVTPDYQANDEGVSMDEILNIANSSNAKNKIIILDCCHSGSFGSPQFSGGNTAQIGEGVSILTASKSDEVSIEVNGHGIFTNLLLDALQGGAADLRGHITPGSIYSYIDQALGPWDQRPVFKTNITRFTSIREINAQVPAETLRKLTEYFDSAESKYQLDPSFEFTNDPSIEHEYTEPYASEENVEIFKDLQKFAGVGLVVPVTEQHMYFAAINSKSCRLTALGYHYWRLVKEKRI